MKRNFFVFLGAIFGLSLFISVMLFAEPTNLSAKRSPESTFVVTSNADTDDGTCDNHCTLREAINAAQDGLGADTIVFNLLPTSRTISVTSALPAITDTLMIDGSNVVSLTINASLNPSYNFYVDIPAVVTMTHLSVVSTTQTSSIWNYGELALQHMLIAGNESGAINYGVLEVEDVIFLRNGVPNGCGAGINNVGRPSILNIIDSRFAHNESQHGGAVCTTGGRVNIYNTTFDSNKVSGIGGAVANVYEGSFNGIARMNIENSYFYNNSSEVGGGIMSNSVLTISNSSFISNSAQYVGGGVVVFSNGNDNLIVETSIIDSTFLSNSVELDSGGGIYHEGRTLSVVNSEFRGNTAVNGGGAILNETSEFNPTATMKIADSTFQENGAQWGGGVANRMTGTMTISNSTFVDNMADVGGGIINQNAASLWLSNSTLSSNTAVTTGGGISNSHQLWLNNVTINENSAASGGGLANGGVLSFTNTLIANSNSEDCLNDGVLALNTFNLIEDTSCSSTLSGDPLLGSLANNGGETMTHLLLAGSPAIDAGDNASCELTDQRGLTRPLDGNDDGTAVCDIGAVEVMEVTSSHHLFLPVILRD